MEQIGEKAKIASNDLSNISLKKRNAVLKQFSKNLKANLSTVLKANQKDILNAQKNKSTIINRLQLNKEKIENIIKSINEIAEFKDPLGKILSSWKRPNGLSIKKISIPIGVIGVIYESRPNVTSDVAALCFKTGNAVILRGGSESFYSNKILHSLFKRALEKQKCNINCVQFISKKNRKNVDYLLSNMKDYIDIIIPRGGKSLIKKVKAKSKVPTIGHLEGVCHVYIDKEADIKMAKRIVINSKMRNFNICGAAETLLLDKMSLKTHCEPILEGLAKLGCKIIGENELKKFYGGKNN
jgi:glutamate-5-semialdehyde dehydrogenase